MSEVPRLAGVKDLMWRASRGEAVSDEEREQLRRYREKYKPAKVSVHLKKGRRQEWEARVDAQGTGLSG